MAGAEPLTLQFLGASATVTGSRYLLRTGRSAVLVDCGLFQGYKQLRLRNWARFPVSPRALDAVVLTHAHLDHSGCLPRLVAEGFNGPVYCTEATLELCKLLLPDSGRLQEEEASYAARKHYSRHTDPQPLYTEKQAIECLQRFRPVKFDETWRPAPDVEARLLPAGHLLGAAQVVLEARGRRIHFSGDLGRADDAMMRPPAPFRGADVLVCESTYGNRKHADVDVEREIGKVIRRVTKRKGVVIIPAFAVGRVQAVMLHIARLRERGEIPKVPVYLNSPMAITATGLYHRFRREHRLSDDECQRMCEIATPINSIEQSKALNARGGPMVLISASGMLTGGRVLHHVASYGPDPRNAILLVGFQAGGTRGAALVRGCRELRIFGREVPINAEVISLDGLSGHADADGILDWARNSPAPQQVFVTHGEPDAADALRARLERELRWSARVPEHLEEVQLT